MRKMLFVFGILLLFLSCKNTQCSSSAELLVVKSTSNDGEKSQAMVEFLTPFRTKLSEKMDVRLATSAQIMTADRPESLLSNLICDVLLKKANKYLKTDFSIYNIGGLRNALPQGDVYLRTIYEILSFDNQLVILSLLGEDVDKLCQSIARVGGEGVAGISFYIENGIAKDIRIQNIPLDKSRIYHIATNDYLSLGNDKMEPLANHTDIVYLNLKVRDIFVDYIVDLESRGEVVSSKLDGRIYKK